MGSTFSLLLVTLIAAGIAPWWPLRLLLSVLGALLMVRAFITYHDYMHGSILRNSAVAWLLFRVPGKKATIIITAMWVESATRASAPSR